MLSFVRIRTYFFDKRIRNKVRKYNYACSDTIFGRFTYKAHSCHHLCGAAFDLLSDLLSDWRNPGGLKSGSEHTSTYFTALDRSTPDTLEKYVFVCRTFTSTKRT